MPTRNRTYALLSALALALPACEPDSSPLATETAAATFASYYVSPTGSDSNAGTQSAPFQTIAKARDVVRTVNGSMSGDIYVYLRGGNYPITSPIAFGPQDSGTNGYRIRYQAYPGETPVLNGATKVTGWTQYSGSIYKASLNRSTKLRNLFVNDQRAQMTSKRVTAQGGSGTYSINAGQASWAWTSGSKSDGVIYSTSDVPSISTNKDDLEIINGTTWNENIACTRDVVTSGNSRVLLLQQPYGSIAQTPGWGAGFTVSGSHTIYNVFEWLNSPGQFYFDKTTKTLYYYLRSGESIDTADVEAPIAEQLITITGASTSNRVKYLTFQGLTFANTDYGLLNIAGSTGKASVQAATLFIAFQADGNQHTSKYELMDTLPSMVNVNNADSIDFTGNTFKHSGDEGVSFINDVINSNIVGNVITDMAGSGITVGHPQHVYIGDGGSREKFQPGIEGVCKNNSISNNFIYNTSTAPGFGSHAGITAFFVDTLQITYNHIELTAYNGINLGWGWRNFPDSTTCKNNTVSYNRLFNNLNRLHDSGAIYTIGQMPGTTINQNYVKGIPSNSTGPTYGLHNDEGSAYITENDNVLNIDPGVTYTINCEDYGAKHDLTILRTYATVNKMGAKPPNSTIDTPVAVSDNVWPVTQYGYCLNSGVQDAYRSIIPANRMATLDYVFPASVTAAAGTAVAIRSSGDASNSVWFAPSGTTSFAVSATMTSASGTATSIYAPNTAGNYKLFLVNAQGAKLSESNFLLRVTGSASCASAPSTPANLQAAATSSSQVNLTWSVVTAPSGCSVTYSVFRNGTQIASSVSSGAYSDTRLAASTTYQYTVRAVDSAGSSASSATASATTQAGGGDGSAISINAGGASSGDFVADAYFSGGSTYANTSTIDTSALGATAPAQDVFQTERYGEFTYTIPGFTAGNAYQVTLYFEESYLTAAGQRLFDVSINGAKVLSGFDIYAAAGSANKAVAKVFTTAADASGQVAIQFAKGTAENPKVCGIAVAPIVNPTCSSAPSAPSGLTASAISASQIQLAWSAVSPPANCSVTYSVFRGSTQVATGLTTSSFSDTGLAAGTSYTYTVRAVDSAGSSASSSAATATTLVPIDTQPPSAPSSLSAPNVGTTTVTLTWNASTDNVGVTGYDILWGSGSIGSSNATSATVSNLLPGTSYTFTVKARDAAGNTSQPSGSLLVTTIPATDVTPPSAPANLAWASDSGTVTLTWTASTDDFGVTAYELFYGNFSLGSFSDTVLTLIGFKPGTPYSFTVKAHDAAGNLSVASNPITVLLAAPTDTTPPTAPSNLATTSLTSSSVGLAWTASTDDVGVVVYQVLVNGGLAVTVTSPKATVSGLSPGTSYSVTAVALDAAGNRSPLSTALSVTTSP